MTQKQKAIAEFNRKPPPKNMKWQDFVKCLAYYGYIEKSENGGSHRTFINEKTSHQITGMVKPHPGNEVKSLYIKQARKCLEANRGLNNE